MAIKGLNTLYVGQTEVNFPLLTESDLVMWERVRLICCPKTGPT